MHHLHRLTVPLLGGLIATLVTATALVAEDAAALIAQGDRLAQEYNLEGAMQSYQEATRVDDQSATAFLRLGGMQIMTGKYEASINSFRSAIGLDREGASGFIGMGIAYLHMGQYELARAAFTEARQRDSSRQTEIDQLLDWLSKEAPGAQQQPATGQ